MRRLLGLLVSLVLVAPVGAADIPIFGKQLLLKDPSSRAREAHRPLP